MKAETESPTLPGAASRVGALILGSAFGVPTYFSFNALIYAWSESGATILHPTRAVLLGIARLLFYASIVAFFAWAAITNYRWVYDEGSD